MPSQKAPAINTDSFAYSLSQVTGLPEPLCRSYVKALKLVCDRMMDLDTSRRMYLGGGVHIEQVTVGARYWSYYDQDSGTLWTKVIPAGKAVTMRLSKKARYWFTRAASNTL